MANRVHFEIPRRATPTYVTRILGDHHTLASVTANQDIPPGHRFLLYFHAMADKGYCEYQEGDRTLKQTLNQAKNAADWDTFERHDPEIQEDWVPLKDGRRHALRAAGGMGEAASRLLHAIATRTDALLGPVDWQRKAVLIAPLATGLGNPHPVENGFAFLSPYGVPYLAGSGVKGVLRRAAEELALFQAESPWTLARVWALFGFDENSAFFENDRSKDSEELKQRCKEWRDAYGRWVEDVERQGDAVFEAWFAVIRDQLPREQRSLAPVAFLRSLAGSESLRRAIHWKGMLAVHDALPCKGASLAVDILNPHHKNYLENGGQATPHDAENPVPVFFLTIAPGAHFTFSARPLPGRAGFWKALGDWRPLIDKAFEHACDWLGFGAKTAVGYGAMEHQTEEAVRQGTPGTAPKPLVEVWEGAGITWTKGNQMLSASVAGRKAQCVGHAGKTLLDSLPEDIRKRLDKGKEVIAPVEVEPLGNAWRLVAVVAAPAVGPE